MERKIYGLEFCRIKKVLELMPDLKPIFDKLEPQFYIEKYLISVFKTKLHPGQYGNAPGRHYDFMPERYDKESNRIIYMPEKRINRIHIYSYFHGGEGTLFFDEDGSISERQPEQGSWFAYSQMYEHEAQPAKEECEKLFIRVAPECIVHPKNKNIGDVNYFMKIWE